jgi:hypothetical protein
VINLLASSVLALGSELFLDIVFFFPWLTISSLTMNLTFRMFVIDALLKRSVSRRFFYGIDWNVFL